MKSIFTTLMLILLLVLSCAAKKDLLNSESVVEANPKLIFLNYSISEDNHGIKTVNFISKTITDGKLKNQGNKYIETGHIGDLKCAQLNNKSQTLRSVFIKNPLNKTMEFVNDSMQFERKSLKLKKASLSLRLQLHPETRTIEISEIIDSSQNVNPLYSNKLKLK